MNLPNGITVGRIALIPVFLLLALGHSTIAALAAFAVFVIASATDSLDGRLARQRGQTTRTGSFLDPLADKLLLASALVVLVAHRGFPLWAALVIAAREVAVQVLRTQIVRSGGDLPASPAGKMKTFLQGIMVGWWLLPWERNAGHWVLLGVVLVATLWSGGEYLFRAQMVRKVVG
ncbi:MAG TPA: CDP-diacylglycerol--glycerol-3-phosphate 3-phosphatidyltransferase [Actinomycetota bacterium]|jgi:CDP-diacylglycerol--glycerol-3-phosphate 3-phosphatidyltransferase|nr:CDP-diacylglycerol--glycerol-3-phosphate 3-phosphatidyltransferase [Actinomycetota bacterium]